MEEDYQVIVEALRTIVVDELMAGVDVNRIDESADLRTDVGLDSISFLELRAICEQRFKVVISDEDYSPAGFGSLSRLSRLIMRLRASN